MIPWLSTKRHYFRSSRTKNKGPTVLGSNQPPQQNRDNSINPHYIAGLQHGRSQLEAELAQLRQTASKTSDLEDENKRLREQVKKYQESLSWAVETEARAQKELEALRPAKTNPESEPDKARPKCTDEFCQQSELAQQVEQLTLSVEQKESRLKYLESQATELEKKRDAQRLKAERRWMGLTPRLILMERIIRKQFADKSGADSAANEKVKRTDFLNLTNDLLDAELSPELARNYYQNTAYYYDKFGMFAKTCHRCGLFKLGFQTGPPSMGELAPAPALHEKGSCPFWVCKKCSLEGIMRNVVEANWMADLRGCRWLRCPSPQCPAPCLRIPSTAAFRDLLLGLEDKEVGVHTSLFDHILRLRSRLSEWWQSHDLDETTTDIAFSFYESLVKSGLMVSIVEPEVMQRPDPLFTNSTGQQTNPTMVEVNVESGVFHVPFFPALLRKDTTTQECLYCMQELPGAEAGLWLQWRATYPQFQGDWVWDNMVLPSRLSLVCSHPIDFCAECLDRHIKAKLDDYGRVGCDKIACPGADCGRPLSYDEIRQYAKVGTFAMYDQYLNLNALSQLPNFRWCLGPDCNNGQLYELQEDSDLPEGGPMIVCQECNFQMCYTHSVAWHEGQDCKQYDSEHSDPNSQLSRTWIDVNTKNCPRCNVSITKGNYCFHMTCNCGFEFCWVCLADWKLICPAENTYDQTAHAEGCYFRTSVVAPTELMGTSVTQALERRGIRRWLQR